VYLLHCIGVCVAIAWLYSYVNVGALILCMQEIVVGLKEKQVPYMSCKFVTTLLACVLGGARIDS
jgi:hypothetical protein